MSKFFQGPLPQKWLLLGSPMLMDHHPSQQHAAGLQQAVCRPSPEVTRSKHTLTDTSWLDGRVMLWMAKLWINNVQPSGHTVVNSHGRQWGTRRCWRSHSSRCQTFGTSFWGRRRLARGRSRGSLWKILPGSGIETRHHPFGETSFFVFWKKLCFGFFFKKMGQPLSFIFSILIIYYNCTTNQCEECPSSIQPRDSNSQPPLTTGPGLSPHKL